MDLDHKQSVRYLGIRVQDSKDRGRLWYGRWLRVVVGELEDFGHCSQDAHIVMKKAVAVKVNCNAFL